MQTAMEDRDFPFLQSALDMILCQMRSGGKIAVIPEQFLQLVFDGSKAPQTVSDYAAELNVTPNYLNKTVKQHTHRTAIDWIEIARLNMAKMLLKDRTVPIGDVAGRVGVPDQSYFARFFKKKTGLTPSEFRNS
jgi:AraC-like DNA-binding protein